MTLKHQIKHDIMAIKLEGEIDYEGADELRKFLFSNLTKVKKIFFDMQDVEYSSSEGINVLLEADLIMRKRGGIHLRNVDPTLAEALDEIGITRVLDIK